MQVNEKITIFAQIKYFIYHVPVQQQDHNNGKEL